MKNITIAILFTTIGILLPKLAYAQEKFDTGNPAYIYKTASQDPFLYPEDDIENDRAAHFLNNISPSTVACIDSPELAGSLIDQGGVVDLLPKSQTLDYNLALEKISNIAIDPQLYQDNHLSESIPITLEYSTSLFSWMSHNTYYDRCIERGGQSIQDCPSLLGVELSPGHPNYYATNNQFMNINTPASFIQEQLNMCRLHQLCLSGAADEGMPCSDITPQDQEACNLVANLTVEQLLSPGYEKERLLLSGVNPVVALEKGYLICTRDPRSYQVGNIEYQFGNQVTSVARMYWPALFAIKRNLQNTLQSFLTPKKFDQTIEIINNSTYFPYDPPPITNPDNPIKTYPEGSTPLIKAVINKINQLNLQCSDPDDTPTQPSGATSDSQMEGSARINFRWLYNQAKLASQETLYSHACYLVAPGELEHIRQLSLVQAQNNYPPPVSTKLSSRHAKIPLNINTDFPEETSVQYSPPTPEPISDPTRPGEPSVKGIVSRLFAKLSFSGKLKKNTGLPGAEPQDLLVLNISHNLKQTLSSNARKRWSDPCYERNVIKAFGENLTRLIGLTSSQANNCPKLLERTASADACVQIGPREPDPNACSLDNRLGFNVGYGTHNWAGNGACSDANGKPVTFLVDYNTPIGSPSDRQGQNTLWGFANCYENASKRIVRITGFNANTDLTLTASNLSQVFNTSKDYIVLGNELNNLSHEYSGCGANLQTCGSMYAAQFQTFRNNYTSSGNLSAAPLDTSNSDYDAAQFLAAAQAAYLESTFVAANSYRGVSGCADPQRCSETSYQWMRDQAGGNKPVILTEYSLAPGKDTSLTAVEEFITSTVPRLPSYVIAVTPLIRNTCYSGGEWLRYNCNTQEFVTANDNALDKSATGENSPNKSQKPQQP